MVKNRLRFIKIAKNLDRTEKLLMAKTRNDFTDSDHLFAYHIHLITKKGEIELKDAEFKLIALSRKVKRTRGSWGRKVMNFDHIRDGGSQHGNAHEIYKEFKDRYEEDPTRSISKAISEAEPVSEAARNLLISLGFPGGELPAASKNMKPIFWGVIGKGDVIEASKKLARGKGLDGFNDSTTYDVIIDGKPYPPKHLSALAYKIASGYEIKGSDFEGGKNTPCFDFLSELGFQIIEKGAADTASPDKIFNMKMCSPKLLTCALAAKPFSILAGGTGTGKTRSAKLAAVSIAGTANVEVVAVGADWTDNRPLLGFRNLLAEGGKTYVAPPALRITLTALENPGKPYFLVLD